MMAPGEEEDEDHDMEEEDEVYSEVGDEDDEDDEEDEEEPKRRRRVTPPMVVTYRLTGVDGEATEERYEQVEAQDDGRRKQDQSQAAVVIASSGGLEELVRCCSSRDAPELAGRALQLLALCADAGYASDLAKRGASGALLARLVAELRNKKTSQNTLVPRILSLLETLAPAAAAEDLSLIHI